MSEVLKEKANHIYLSEGDIPSHSGRRLCDPKQMSTTRAIVSILRSSIGLSKLTPSLEKNNK